LVHRATARGWSRSSIHEGTTYATCATSQVVAIQPGLHTFATNAAGVRIHVAHRRAVARTPRRSRSVSALVGIAPQLANRIARITLGPTYSSARTSSRALGRRSGS